MAILKEEPPQLDRADRPVTPELADLVDHCLEKSPSERFQSARDLAFALRGADREGRRVSSAPHSGGPAERTDGMDAFSGERSAHVSGADAPAPPRDDGVSRRSRSLRFSPSSGSWASFSIGRSCGSVLSPLARRPATVADPLPFSGSRIFRPGTGGWLSTALSEMVSAEAAAGGRSERSKARMWLGSRPISGSRRPRPCPSSLSPRSGAARVRMT